MITVSAQKSIEDSQVSEGFARAFDQTWKAQTKPLKSQFVEIVRSILLAKSESWIVPEEALEKYPWFRDKVKFIESYCQCFEFKVEGYQIEFFCDPVALGNKGFPEDIGQLLEFGAADLSPIPHFFEAMQIWEQKYRDQFLQSILDETLVTYGQ